MLVRNVHERRFAAPPERVGVTFRFTSPPGFHGTHAFIVEAADRNATLLRHELVMDTSGPARITWPVIFRPLHDALIEDALDRAAIALGESPRAVPFSLWVRALRALLRRGRPAAAATARR